ncbi:MAG: SCP2 sterol-binding domain-containing protein [Candidatus Rokuibacteriota bacterium]
MLAFLAPTPTPGRAAAIIRQIFGGLPASFAFRLWDGREVRFGSDAPACTAVIKSPETFLALIRNPTPYNFAEAYVQSRLDVEGDLFQAMDVANVIENLKVTPRQKVSILLSLWRR